MKGEVIKNGRKCVGRHHVVMVVVKVFDPFLLVQLDMSSLSPGSFLGIEISIFEQNKLYSNSP